MSLEDFLVKNGSETFHIAAAYQLLEWAKDVAYINHKEKAKKYEEVQEEVATLVEKYGVTDNEIFGAACDLDGQQPMLKDYELMEMADKLVAHEEGWN
jgi:hypothetical protein